MRTSTLITLSSCLALASLGNAGPVQRNGKGRTRGKNNMGASCGASGSASQAAYIISNADVNSVVAMSIGNDGMLSGATITQTGGAGGASIDAKNNQPAKADPLVSQSALTVAGSHLFAVNAGSNTVSMLTISPSNATQLTMAGQPAAVPGEFPNTVAASARNKVVCAAMTGAVSGISCAPFTAEGIGAFDALRPIALNQTTPPVGPTNTISQLFFSADESMLFATVKGDPTKNNTGFLASFTVASCPSSGASMITSQGTRASPEGTAVLFGSSVIPGSTDLFVTDASFGAAVLSVGNDASDVQVKGKGAVDGQAATCWAAISPATKTAFVTDVAKNRLVEMSTADAKIVGEIDLSANGQPGMIDLRAGGKMLYVLAPGTGETQPAVVVVDVEKKEQAQFFELGSMGVSSRAQGMALFGF